MAETAVRMMQLLTLLQRRRHWSGAELADRLDVSERTLRRDIDRLRRLGYTIGSDPGVDGGYELMPGVGLAPLLLDDEEAVALAVSLHLAARGDTDLAEAAVSTLTKVLATLPPQQRRRAESIVETTAATVEMGTPTPPVGVLATVAEACRDGVRLSFDYRSGEVEETERYVEPCRLVSLYGRWYLVAFDCDRDDWRTFRVDRLSGPRPTRNQFTPRPAPADDVHEYVRARIRTHARRFRVIIDIESEPEPVEERWGRWVQVSERPGRRCRVEFETDSFQWPLVLIAETEAASTVVSPPELKDYVQRVALRLGAAAADRPGGR